MSQINPVIVWFRRDLRIDDNQSLINALSLNRPIIAIFIYDKDILDLLESNDKRMAFIEQSVNELQTNFAKTNTPFFTFYGKVNDIIPTLSNLINPSHLFAGEDYESYAIDRDNNISTLLQAQNVKTNFVLEHAIFSPNQILTGKNTFYSVYTPFKNAWLKKFNATNFNTLNNKPYNDLKLLSAQFTDYYNSINQCIINSNLFNLNPKLKDIGFNSSCIINGGESNARIRAKVFSNIINQYKDKRDNLDQNHCSQLGVDLRFGTISPRRLALWAKNLNTENASFWLSELIWRDFWIHLLYNNPDSELGIPHQSVYKQINYPNPNNYLTAWQNAQTGYPIIDAAINQLLQTGFMANRARMITASFLTKNLLTDWKLGHEFFAKHLLDYDLASNIGNWQWCSGVGADAAPYFRVFNPVTQSQKFDKDGVYIKKWLPALKNLNSKQIHDISILSDSEKKLIIGKYPDPIVDLKISRLNAIDFLKNSKI